MCVHAWSCLTLCDPMDCSLLGSSVHRIFQARILEWVAEFPSPGHLPNPGIKPVSLASLALTGGFFTTSAIWDLPCMHGGRQLLFLIQHLQLWTVAYSLVTCLIGPIRKSDMANQCWLSIYCSYEIPGRAVFLQIPRTRNERQSD